jgi:hypothetical protein
LRVTDCALKAKGLRSRFIAIFGMQRALYAAAKPYGGVQMKLASLLVATALIAALVVMVAPVAKADGVPPGDPVFKGGGDAPLPGEVAAPIFQTTFTISCMSGTCPGADDMPTGIDPCDLTEGSYSNSSPSCYFVNDLEINGVGQVLDALTFLVPGIPPGGETGVSCALLNVSTVITGCNVTSDGDGGSMVSFSADIPYGTNFLIDLEGFTGGVTTTGYASLPEPGSLAMLGLGLVGLFGWNLKRKRSIRAAQ